MTTNPESVEIKNCSECDASKTIDCFYKTNSICRECTNLKRRIKYKTDEEHRKKLIKQATSFKHKKVVVNQRLREEEQQKIGMDNKQCKYCYEVKPKDRFRHNRLKCRDCERDEPVAKFKRSIRARIYICLRSKKTHHSIQYLGCSSDEYFDWIFDYDNCCDLNNHGKLWHIDHVIPLSKFNLNNEEEQFVAFNWRNTMPLSCEKNLKKNNKIIIEQIASHFEKLKEYHKKKKLEFPQMFIDLFAKHLVDGDPLKLSLPLTTGNFCEDHD